MHHLDFLLQNTPVYPFRFEPVYKNYLWGGSRFRSLFNRPLPDDGKPFAESWEVSDHPNGQSVVRNGPLRGKTLREVVCQRADELFGTNGVNRTDASPKRFPLLLKYLDAFEPLSIQVHPDDRLAGELGFDDPGKSEAWVVVAADPGSAIWVGTRRPYSRRELSEAIRNNVPFEAILNRVEVKPGDCYYLPPGTLHALGEGVLVAEVQTNSDLTFRLYDWDRLDTDGKPRQLMVEEGIRALADTSQPVVTTAPRMSAASRRQCERLISTNDFSLNRWTLDEPVSWKSDRRCHLWTVLDGSVDALFTAGRRVAPRQKSGRDTDPDAIETLHRGDTILVPAVCENIRWIPESGEPTILLDVIVERV